MIEGVGQGLMNMNIVTSATKGALTNFLHRNAAAASRILLHRL